MPKTAVDKNDLAKPWKDQIRYPRQFTYMKPVSKAHAMYQTANKHLRSGIGTSDPRHPLTSLSL